MSAGRQMNQFGIIILQSMFKLENAIIQIHWTLPFICFAAFGSRCSSVLFRRYAIIEFP